MSAAREKTVGVEPGKSVSPARRGPVDADSETEDAALPHWGPLRRAIHARCKRSRRFNTIVSALEMRLGREELLSLPGYMAICPTGQCNALCEFCSVTVNRTGIIKRQLPFDRLRRFIGPVRSSACVHCIEAVEGKRW